MIFLRGLVSVMLLTGSAVALASGLTLQEGTYQRPCFFVNDDALTSEIQLANGSFTRTYVAYEDESCTKPYLEFATIAKAESEDQALTLAVQKVSYKSLTDEVTEALNMIAYCGEKDWQTGKEKVVTGKLCDEYQVSEKDQKFYTLWKFQESSAGQELWIGEAEKDFNGSSPDRRPKKYEATGHVKKP